MSGIVCPLPATAEGCIELGHGGGGALTHRLIAGLFRPAFGVSAHPPGEMSPHASAGAPRHDVSGAPLHDLLGAPPHDFSGAPLHDGATLAVGGSRLAFTTDSFVVTPLEFPGGDIGALAVIGTVNDLAMCGARPLSLSAGFILEEGLEIALLRRLAGSMGRAAAAAGVGIVTGDTKVVERGKGDGLYISTAGVGLIPPGVAIGPHFVCPGDAVLVSGDIGRHGIAIMAAREGLGFESPIASDMANLAPAVDALHAAGVAVHCLRDLTRGGLATALVEIARQPEWRCRSMRRPSRCRSRCGGRAKFSVSIRGTWRTRAGWWLSSPRRRRRGRWRCCAPIPAGRTRPSSAGSRRRRGREGCALQRSAGPGCSIC